MMPCMTTVSLLLLLVIYTPHLSHGGQLSGLSSSLLDYRLMPPSLLVQSQLGLPSRDSQPLKSNASVGYALSTMGFHRRMMNEYLCRGYMAEDILNRLQRNADDDVSAETIKDDVPQTMRATEINKLSSTLQNRRGSNEPSRKNVSTGRSTTIPRNHRPNKLLTDEGSSNYRDWLSRSAVLEDIYRRYENADPEPESESRQDKDGREHRDDDYDGEVTGWAMEEPHWPKQDTGRNPNVDDGEDYGEMHHHPYEPIVTSSTQHSSLSLGVRDIYDVALTAIAFLAFGIFILNITLGILLPTSSTRTVVISNLTLPFRSRDGAIEVNDDDKTHDRIARWVEDEPLERVETAEESAARFALATLRAALKSKHAHCLQAALCLGNKQSRSLQGQAKYWLPIWSLGMSWLARRAGGDPDNEPSTSSLFSGALENLRASTLGLAGARCNELFPAC